MSWSSISLAMNRIVEKLADSDVAYEDRQVVYDIILEVFDEYDMKSLKDCLDTDSAFDETWYERYPPEPEEYED